MNENKTEPIIVHHQNVYAINMFYTINYTIKMFFFVNDFITTSKLDFVFLTETLFEQSSIEAIRIETDPPNFDFMDLCRSGIKGGEVRYSRMYFRANNSHPLNTFVLFWNVLP